MSKTALVIISDGCEEMEAVIVIDVLRRGGIIVTVAGLDGPEPVCCSRDVTIVPDTGLSEAAKDQYDVIILPGGKRGSENLSKSERVKSLLQSQEKQGKLVAAICAAPTVLKSHSVCLGKVVTSYPTMQSVMEAEAKYSYSQERVVEDGQLITSRGPGTAFEFALALVSKLVGSQKSKDLVEEMLFKY